MPSGIPFHAWEEPTALCSQGMGLASCAKARVLSAFPKVLSALGARTTHICQGEIQVKGIWFLRYMCLFKRIIDREENETKRALPYTDALSQMAAAARAGLDVGATATCRLTAAPSSLLLAGSCLGWG